MVDTEYLMNGLLDLGLSEREARVLLTLLTKQGASLSEVQMLYAKADHQVETPLENVEILCGLNHIHHHYCRLLRNAREEILSFVCPPYACDDQEKLDEQLREYEAFMERGGTLRWVFEVGAGAQVGRRDGPVDH